MPLCNEIRCRRVTAGLTQEQLARSADISKTYIWELENDEKGEKKPSAEVLLRIASALGTTIAELLEQRIVTVNQSAIELPSSLLDFADQRKKIGQPITDEDLRDLAITRFRGGQPTTAEGWEDLYLALKRTAGR